MSKTTVEVKHLSGTVTSTALDNELIEAGDIIVPAGKVPLRLMGTNAHGIKRFHEIEAPEKHESADVNNADGEVCGAALTPIPPPPELRDGEVAPAGDAPA